MRWGTLVARMFDTENSDQTNLEETLNVSVYPNPVKDIVNIESSISVNKITVTNIAGQIVAEQVNSTSIDLSGLNSGIYVINVLTKEGSKNFKIIKE